MSCAKIGSSAVADEKNVAKKSSSIVDRMSGDRNTNRSPSSAAPQRHFVVGLVRLAHAAGRDVPHHQQRDDHAPNDSALHDIHPADAGRRDR